MEVQLFGATSSSVVPILFASRKTVEDNKDEFLDEIIYST